MYYYGRREFKTCTEIPQRDEKSVRPKWADIPALIAGIAIFAFVASTLYDWSIASKFHYSVRDYLDLTDYIQFLPLYWSDYWVLIFLALLFPVWYVIIFVRNLRTVQGARKLEEVRSEKKCKKVTWRSAILLSLPALYHLSVMAVAFFIVGNLFKQSGDLLTQEINRKGICKVFRKGELCPIEGKIFLNTHRYILLLNKSDLLTAIPQEEVQMIETQANVVK